MGGSGLTSGFGGSGFGGSGFGGSGLGGGGSGGGGSGGGGLAATGGSLSQISASIGGVGLLCQLTPKTMKPKNSDVHDEREDDRAHAAGLRALLEGGRLLRGRFTVAVAAGPAGPRA